MKAAGYIRTATTFQAEQGRSLAEQRTRIQDYCEARRLELVTIYEDAGQSGLIADRTGLQALLQAASQREFDVVVVADNSRLSRSAPAFLQIMDVMKRNGMDIIEAEGISQ
jgi:site-specific DNA recombinase